MNLDGPGYILGCAHVKVIRCGISNDDKGIDYAKRAAAKGVRILLGVSAEYRVDAEAGRPHSGQFVRGVPWRTNK